ncbi:hypothetical protein [Vibrio sp. 10N]|uniref:hypothetical protein n=1 Tax=Vibrio sp. 10N TaxID=3058938 RepID=UPI0028143017|nr:hypothetical protein VB10N_46430 [Vibrio sp. 10N]
MDRTIKELMRNPNALAKFHLTGQLPTVTLQPSEETPLRSLINHIPVRYWSMFRGTTLSRDLGFKNTAMKFSNLHQLMRYIGFNRKVARAERLPYQFYIDRSKQTVTLSDLVEATRAVPNAKLLDNVKACLPEHLK